MVDASSIDNGLLIYLIERHPVLWEKNNEFNKNRIATLTAWKQVLKSLYPEYTAWNNKTRKACVKLIKQRWARIRDSHCRSFKKQAEKGIDGRPTKPYLYSTKLAFLHTVPGNASSEIENDYEITDISENSFDTHDMGSTNSSLEHMFGLEDIHTHSDDANDPFSTQEPLETNRHLLFFKAILPSLNDFDDNETIDFQMGVLKLLKKIKSSGQSQQFPNIKFEDDSNSPGYSWDQWFY